MGLVNKEQLQVLILKGSLIHHPWLLDFFPPHTKVLRSRSVAKQGGMNHAHNFQGCEPWHAAILELALWNLNIGIWFATPIKSWEDNGIWTQGTQFLKRIWKDSCHMLPPPQNADPPKLVHPALSWSASAPVCFWANGGGFFVPATCPLGTHGVWPNWNLESPSFFACHPGVAPNPLLHHQFPWNRQQLGSNPPFQPRRLRSRSAATMELHWSCSVSSRPAIDLRGEDAPWTNGETDGGLKLRYPGSWL